MDSDGNWRWHTLVHVCRGWRHIDITSPRRLDLRLLCTARTSVKKYLNCWPTFPIAIKYNRPFSEDVFNIFVALENRDRVSSIQLSAGTSLLERVSRVMQVPFPALKNLSLDRVSRKLHATLGPSLTSWVVYLFPVYKSYPCVAHRPQQGPQRYQNFFCLARTSWIFSLWV